MTECHTELQVLVPYGASLLKQPAVRLVGTNHGKSINYAVIAFMTNGQLHTECNSISNMLGLPPCSHKQWYQIIEWLEEYVTKLAEWSCKQVHEQVREWWSAKMGDIVWWLLSHSLATLHDYPTGNTAWFKHWTKQGPGHNWEGTLAGAEADMFNEILGEVKENGFTIQEMVTDKDMSMNVIYCHHFPEGTITSFSQEGLKQIKCQVTTNNQLVDNHFISSKCTNPSNGGKWVFQGVVMSHNLPARWLCVHTLQL